MSEPLLPMDDETVAGIVELVGPAGPDELRLLANDVEDMPKQFAFAKVHAKRLRLLADNLEAGAKDDWKERYEIERGAHELTAGSLSNEIRRLVEDNNTLREINHDLVPDVEIDLSDDDDDDEDTMFDIILRYGNGGEDGDITLDEMQDILLALDEVELDPEHKS